MGNSGQGSWDTNEGKMVLRCPDHPSYAGQHRETHQSGQSAEPHKWLVEFPGQVGSGPQQVRHSNEIEPSTHQAYTDQAASSTTQLGPVTGKTRPSRKMGNYGYRQWDDTAVCGPYGRLVTKCALCGSPVSSHRRNSEYKCCKCGKGFHRVAQYVSHTEDH